MTDNITLAIAIDSTPATAGAAAISRDLDLLKAKAAETIAALKGVGTASASGAVGGASGSAAANQREYAQATQTATSAAQAQINAVIGVDRALKSAAESADAFKASFGQGLTTLSAGEFEQYASRLLGVTTSTNSARQSAEVFRRELGEVGTGLTNLRGSALAGAINQLTGVGGGFKSAEASAAAFREELGAVGAGLVNFRGDALAGIVNQLTGVRKNFLSAKDSAAVFAANGYAAAGTTTTIDRGSSGLSAASGDLSVEELALGGLPSAGARQNLASSAYAADQAAKKAAAQEAAIQLAKQDIARAKLDVTTGQLSASEGKYAAAQGAANLALAQGTVDAETHAAMTATLAQKYDAEAKAAEKAASTIKLNAREAREAGAAIREVAVGDFARMPGTAIALANAANLFTGSVLVWGAALAVPVGIVATLIAEFARLNAEVKEFTTATAAYNSHTFSPTDLQAMAHGIAANGPFSRGDADSAVLEIAKSRSVPGSVGRGIAGASGPLAEATGMKSAAAAAKELVSAYGEGYVGIQKLEKEFGMLTPAEMEAAHAMADAGDQAGAFNLAIDALHTQMQGAVDNASGPGTHAFRDMIHAWTNVLDEFVQSDAFIATMQFLGRAGTSLADHLAGKTPVTVPTNAYSDMAIAYARAHTTTFGGTMPPPLADGTFAGPGGFGFGAGGPHVNDDMLGAGEANHYLPDQLSIIGARTDAARSRLQNALTAKQMNGGPLTKAATQSALDQKDAAERVSAVQKLTDKYELQAAASVKVADAYGRSTAAGEAEGVLQDVLIENYGKEIPYVLSHAEAIDRSTVALNHFIEVNAMRIAQFAQEDIYRQKEISASRLSSGALSEQKSLDDIARKYDPQIAIAGMIGADPSRLTTQKAQEQAEVLRNEYTDFIESLNTEGRRARDKAAGENSAAAMAGAMPMDVAYQRNYGSKYSELTSPFKGTSFEGNSALTGTATAQAKLAGTQAKNQSTDETRLKLLNEIHGAQGEAAQDIKVLNDLYQTGAVTLDQYDAKLNQLYIGTLQTSRDWADGVELGFRQFADGATNYGAKSAQFVTTALDKTTDAFSAVIEQTKTWRTAFHDLAQSVTQDLTKMFVQTQITGPLAQLLGIGTAGANGHSMGGLGSSSGGSFLSGLSGLFGGGSSYAGMSGIGMSGAVPGGFASGGGGAFAGLGGAGSSGGFFDSIFSDMFADGGIMSAQGRIPIRTYSGGGIATSPQAAIFAEGGVPEAYVPVPSGKIPVTLKHSGGGGGHTINMHNYVEAGASMADVDAAVRRGIAAAAPGIHARAVKESVVRSTAHVYDQARRGGTFAAALAGNRSP